VLKLIIVLSLTISATAYAKQYGGIPLVNISCGDEALVEADEQCMNQFGEEAYALDCTVNPSFNTSKASSRASSEIKGLNFSCLVKP
jgi:hypothetical protein